jgi:hypothetical protein
MRRFLRTLDSPRWDTLMNFDGVQGTGKDEEQTRKHAEHMSIILTRLGDVAASD